MRIGICLPHIGPAAGARLLGDYAVEAERLGFDSLWVEEHLFRPLEPVTGYGGVPGMPWPEKHRTLLAPLPTLSFVAARTTTIGLGTSVVVAGHHHPLRLAKEVATIDVLSGGRMTLGLGVGWCEDEYNLVGTPFRQRGMYADESLEVLRRAWGPDPVEFRGELIDIPLSETSPKPARGHLPIAGGFQSRAGLRRVARWCDSWQPFGIGPEDAAAGIAEVNRIARDDFDRGPLELSMRVLLAPTERGATSFAGPMGKSTGRWAGDIAALVDHVERMREVGCDELVMDPNFSPGSDDPAYWERLLDDIRPLIATAHAS